jgi:hypothetical protein
MRLTTTLMTAIPSNPIIFSKSTYAVASLLTCSTARLKYVPFELDLVVSQAKSKRADLLEDTTPFSPIGNAHRDVKEYSIGVTFKYTDGQLESVIETYVYALLPIFMFGGN